MLTLIYNTRCSFKNRLLVSILLNFAWIPSPTDPHHDAVRGCIPYYPLSPSMLGFIVRLQLNRIVKRVKQNRDAVLSYGDDVVSHIVSLCRDPDSGGRMIDNILTNDLLPKLSRAFLTAQMNGEELKGVTLKATETGIEIEPAS